MLEIDISPFPRKFVHKLGLSFEATDSECWECFRSLKPIHRGNLYQEILKEKVVPSLQRLARDLGEPMWISCRYLKLSGMPEELLDAFPTRSTIQYRWIRKLSNRLSHEPSIMMDRAKAIQKRRLLGERISARKVFAELTAQ